MDIEIHQIDAFTERVFGGNPAAVCPLEDWLDDATLQAIAVENNLSETAFFVGGGGRYDLRWFTPGAEIDLCGHATLATGHLILGQMEPGLDIVRFQTLSGELTVKRAAGGLLEMDFPSRMPGPTTEPEGLRAALGGDPGEILKSRDLFAIYGSRADVANLTPDISALARILAASAPDGGLIVTAPGDGTDDIDFVSRFFVPHLGIPEDPVTGSAHCTLVPYWARRLGKSELTARQISARGGTVYCTDAGERVLLRGHCADYMTGVIQVP